MLKTKLKGLLFNVLLLCVSVLIALVLIEAFLAFFFPQKATIDWIVKPNTSTFDPMLGYRHAPHEEYAYYSNEFKTRIKINSEGFRDDEFSVEKNPDTERIMALGDSFTYAAEVDVKKRFTELIEKMASADVKKVDVLNFGTGGYGTCQEYSLLKQEATTYHPEKVVLFFYIGNDFYENDLAQEYRPQCSIKNDHVDVLPAIKGTKNKGTVSGLIINSHVLSLMMNTIRFSRVSSTISKVIGRQSSYSEVLDLFDKKRNVRLENLFNLTESILTGMKEFLDENQISFTVVVIPHRIQVDANTWSGVVAQNGINPEEYDLDKPNDWLKNVFEKHTINYIDLTPKFREVSREKELYFYHNGHFNTYGHEVAAVQVYQQLQSNT